MCQQTSLCYAQLLISDARLYSQGDYVSILLLQCIEEGGLSLLVLECVCDSSLQEHGHKTAEKRDEVKVYCTHTCVCVCACVCV